MADLKGWQKARKKLMAGIREIKKLGFQLSETAVKLVNTYEPSGVWTRKVNKLFKDKGRYALASVDGEKVTYTEYMALRKGLRKRYEYQVKQAKKQETETGFKPRKQPVKQLTKYDVERIKEFQKEGKRGIKALAEDLLKRTSKEYQDKRDRQFLENFFKNLYRNLDNDSVRRLSNIISKVGKEKILEYIKNSKNADVVNGIFAFDPSGDPIILGGNKNNLRSKKFINEDKFGKNFVEQFFQDMEELI